MSTLARKSKKKVADSWDDESSSSDEEPPAPPSPITIATSPPRQQRSPSPPPPTRRGKNSDRAADFILDETKYAGPSAAFMRGGSSLIGDQTFRGSAPGEEKRPEKTTATAKRLIAQGIGVRVKTTDEEKQYHKAQIENEKRRREEEKRKVEEEEKAKASVWED